MESKLFYVLFYYKCYPTYDLLSIIYDCNRSNACRRQFELGNILEKTLCRKLVLPKRQMKKLEEFFKAFPEAREVFIDGTERPIQIPKDKEKLKENYSGKKKRHTKKTWSLRRKTLSAGAKIDQRQKRMSTFQSRFGALSKNDRGARGNR